MASRRPDDADGTDAEAGEADESPARDEVYASEAEGRQYRSTWYCPLPYDDLDEAPESASYPDRGTGGAFRLASVPRVPRVKHVVGPSAIMLGASLGSGETLFWPGLVARHGWGLYWAFWIGVLTQFVINTELQRWTLATGESIFRAFLRVRRFWPWVFLVGGLASLGWPGWAAGAAKVAATAFGLDGTAVQFVGLELASWKLLAVALMVIIWSSYQLSSVMYNAVEAIQVGLLFVAIAGAVTLALVSGSLPELGGLPAGALNVGTLPPEMDVAVFLGGLAFAGAGGYLNLSQSLWAREKGYAMGNYQGRVRNPLVGDEPEPVRREGFTFRPTRLNLRRWRGWWRVIQVEHFLTFVFGLLFVATIMMSVAARHAPNASADALAMWLTDVAPALGGVGALLVFLVLFVALFTTEYAIVESFVRNSADAVYEAYGRDAGWDLSQLFWRLLTAFTAWGVLIILLFTAPFENRGPFFFLVVGAALSGVIMWPYAALTLVMNTTRLPEHLQPGWARVVAMWWASGFYGFFSVLLVGDTLVAAGVPAFETTVGVLGSGTGGYVLWAAFVAVELYVVTKSILGKYRADGTVPGADEADQPFA
ncbi:Nramp family divalent metal transporter [Salinirarus marinus]|uniref:Nramp family divalent metal transporter n=1 Tax=Salinirarus marinus TaxID=3068310 RepID=UPI003C6C4E27